MKFALFGVVVFATSTALVSSRPVLRPRTIDESLIPQFGWEAGVNPTGTGDCDGAVNGADGKPIKIPCQCPPDRATFIADLNANVDAGHATNNPTVLVSFPTDSSVASQLARLEASIITLQNLNGPGKGCPVVSTTFGLQQKALQDGAPPPDATPASSAAPAASTTPAASSSSSSSDTSGLTGTDAQIAALAPQFGAQSGVNPDGTGNCDGAVKDANGNPIKVPCQCPPPRDEFIQDLIANVHAGHAINNSVVAVSFPLDDSVQSQLARLNAATVTLQNLHGAGVGCPSSSTTFGAQAKAIQAGAASATSPAATSAAPASTSASGSSSPSDTSGLSGTDAQIAALAPQFGAQSGVNPDGTGNCDGAVKNASGQPIKVPCQCPPARDEFIQDLIANVHAGHATTNPTVLVSYPLDDSVQSQLTRLNAAAVTLQNLHGPGVGCPSSSTTFGAQAKALQGQQ